MLSSLHLTKSGARDHGAVRPVMRCVRRWQCWWGTIPSKMQGTVCGLCVPSVWLSRTKMFGCSSRSILVQDKGRGSQAPLPPVTPSRKAGRGNGLRDFGGGGLRWSVWIDSGVTGGRNGAGNPAILLKSRGSEVYPRGSPRGYLSLFEPILALPNIVNCLITKRNCCGYFLFLWYCVADKEDTPQSNYQSGRPRKSCDANQR